MATIKPKFRLDALERFATSFRADFRFGLDEGAPDPREQLRRRLGDLAGRRDGVAVERPAAGEQRTLEIARLTMTHPRTILIDEPSVGLMPILVDTVYEEIIKLKELGYTILIVDQKIHKCLDVVDYIYVLRLGRNSHHGPKEKFVDTIEDIIKEWI